LLTLESRSLYDRILSAQPESLAGIDADGASICYRDLIERAEALGALIGAEPQLVLLEADNSIEWLIAYVACLAGRHPVILAPRDAQASIAHLIGAFQPAIILSVNRGYQPERLSGCTTTTLHPDLAVMLSTSGSTGSAKLVRLSRDNITANADSIALYLGLGADERAAVNLPTHYSYGLSIVNSHLYVGATLLFTRHSVLDAEFWDFCTAHGATSFAGVPQSYELLAKIDLAQRAPRSLRYFTQAGGRLPPELVIAMSELAFANGWRFFVMYGQTEASPRMAYLPPAQAREFPDCIGVAIPGGRLFVTDGQGNEIAQADVEGELAYEGPNVMMGYASCPEDLALPAGPARLSTGDLAVRTTSGLFRITGRISRFIKIFGNRIGLDDVERLLREKAYDGMATGLDNHLLVVSRNPEVEEIAAFLGERLKLPRHCITVRHVDAYPLLASGKIDYASLKQSISPDKAQPTAKTGDMRDVRALFLEIFGEKARDETASFTSLGGDSLTFVTMMLGLEEQIASLPENWPEISIAELAALARKDDGAVRASGRGNVLARVDTVRAIACILVVAYHVVGANPGDGLKLPANSPWHHAVDSLRLIRMPLFTALAGYMYAAMPARLGEWQTFMGGKFRQFGVPLLFATLFYWALRSRLYHEPDSLLDAYVRGYRHLWYLDALLLIFAVVALLDVRKFATTRFWMATMLALPLVSMAMPKVELLHINNTVFLFPFFIFGMIVYRKSNILRNSLIFLVSIFAFFSIISLNQLRMMGYPVTEHYGYLPWLCGWASVVVLFNVTPRIPVLERVAVYSFTIYLWHPAAGAATRMALMKAGVHSTPVLFTLCLLAGTLVPIAMHILLSRTPRLSLPIIGR